MHQASAEDDIRSLYHALLKAWNTKSGSDFAALFTEDGDVVGFDGSGHTGRPVIESDLQRIFAHHLTATYVGIVKTIRFLSPDVAVLRAVAGMVPPEQQDIHPAVNAVQTLVATRDHELWRIALFQNTPAAFHGRPELSQQLTQELRQALRDSSTEAAKP
jgi:uncharacterized protein (TIGR02246 family)